MTAILLSAKRFEQLAYDHALTIELDTTADRAFLQHRGVTYCALLGMSA